jgi:chaperone modulatory protein CbpM
MSKLSKDVIVSGVVLNDDTTTITLTEIRSRYNLQEELLQEMLEHGLIEPMPDQTSAPDIVLHFSAVHRVESALHLYNDLGVNIAGAVLALDLLEQLEEVRAELVILQKQLNLK